MKGTELSVISGCMFAGKTAFLASQIERAEIAGIPVQVFKPDVDTRFGKPNHIVSHNGLEQPAIIVPVKQPGVILEKIDPKTGLAAIDEIQFFEEGIIGVVEELLLREISVLAAGLPLDFRGKPFGSMPILMAMADRITLLTAICTFKDEEGKICGKEATRTQRLNKGKPSNYHDPIVLIGAEDSYAARCRAHHCTPGRPRKTF